MQQMLERKMTSTNKGWELINKIYGDKMFRGDEPQKLCHDVIAFASPTLADATHFGGVPKGILTQFHGPEGGGKTFAAMLQAKQVLDDDPAAEVVWLDAEFSFQKAWATKIGLDMSRVHVMQENIGSELFEILVGIPGKKEAKPKPGILDLKMAGALNVQLIVLDSIAAIVPPVEEGRTVAEQDMAALARFLPKAFRMVMAKLAKANVAMICINQARDLMGARVPTLTYPGGRSYKHTLSLAILFNATQAKTTSLYDANGVKYGHKVICTVEKTRGGPNKQKAEVWFDFRNGRVAKLGEETALLAAAYGVVEKPSATKWSYDGVEVVGRENFFQYLEDNPDVMQKILAECRDVKAKGADRAATLSEDSSVDIESESFGDDDE